MATGLEPARGQVIWEDFESGINPCAITEIGNEEQYKDYPCVYSYKCGEGGCGASDPYVEDGKFIMPVGGDGSYGKLRINENLVNADISIYYSIIGRAYTSAGNWRYNPFVKFVTNFGGEDSLSGVGSKDGVMRLSRDFLDETKYTINIAGRETETILIGDEYYLEIQTVTGNINNNGAVMIDEIRYSKPYTTCTAYGGDVERKDIFGPGVITRWSDDLELSSFSSPVKRFCYNWPSEERDFVEHYTGKQDLDAEIILALGNGQTVTVPNNKIWTIRYLTDNPQPEPCNYDIGEYINSIGGCARLPEEKEPLPEEEIIPIVLGPNEFTFISTQSKTSFEIGNVAVIQILNSDLIEKVNLDDAKPYVSLVDCPNKRFDSENDWSMECVYRIDTSFLTIESIDGYKDIILNSGTKYDVKIINDFVSFDSQHSGIEYKCIRIREGLQDYGLGSERINFAFNKGENIIALPTKDDQKGLYSCDVIPLIQIDTNIENIFSAAQYKRIVYQVIEESQEPVFKEEVEVETKQTLSFWQRFILWLKSLFRF